MKWKSYLRGAGLGLVLAVLITAAGPKNTMSDDEIITRAKALGMVDGNTYLVSEKTEEKTDLPEETVTEIVKPEETKMEESVTEEIKTEETIPEEAVVEETTPEEAVKEDDFPEEIATEETTPEEIAAEETMPEEAVTEDNTAEEAEAAEKDVTHGDMVEFQVQRGDSSVSVSKRLAQAGLVGDADAFDRFLCQNGYDKKIRIGNYQIEMDSSDEQIANIITGKQ